MVSIIILSYNTKDLLYSCLNSIYSFSNHDKDYEVIVVDNFSIDGSTEMVRNSFPKVKLIVNDKNLGFAAGCNVGAKASIGEYLLFLNSDTQMIKNKIRDAVGLLNQHDNLAVVGGSLQNQDGTTSRSYGRFFTIFWTALMLFGLDKLTKELESKKEVRVDWVSGGCMLIKRLVFEKVNGFDEHFFMYIEDVELCYRIKHLGYDIMYYPHFAVIHKAQGSSNRSFAIVHIYKGLLHLYKKHNTFLSYQLLRVMLYIKACSAIIAGIITSNNDLIETYRKAKRVI